jgi:hypothetical protein
MRIRTTIIITLATALLQMGCGTGVQGKIRTLPGTFTWDVDKDRLGHSKEEDFFWQQENHMDRFLVPRNGTRMAILPDATFEAVTAEQASELELTKDRLSGSDEDSVLPPGTVVVFRTSGNRLGVLEIVRYLPLHDLSFPEAKKVPKEARELMESEPNIARYHLVLRWRFLED